MGVKAVLFDAGNTLIYVDPYRLAEMFAAEGLEADADRVVAAERVARRALHEAVGGGHQGTEPEVWRGYFLTLFRELGVPDASMEAVGRRLRETHAADHLWTWVAPGTEEALDELRRDGFRLAVISNADGRMEDLLVRTGLRSWFEFVLDSAVVGSAKPDPEIFLEACRRLSLPPDACLYVGDLGPVDHAGATAVGMQAVLLDPVGLHGSDVPVIGRLGDLPGFVRAL